MNRIKKIIENILFVKYDDVVVSEISGGFNVEITNKNSIINIKIFSGIDKNIIIDTGIFEEKVVVTPDYHYKILKQLEQLCKDDHKNILNKFLNV